MGRINSLERIPQTIEQFKEKNAALAKDIPLLKEIAGKQWKKEDELKGLKSELAALDRKIQLELAKDNEPQQQQAVANGDIYCLIIAGLSLLTTICAKKRTKNLLKSMEIESFCFYLTFFATFATIFRILCWMTVVLSDYLKTKQLTPC